MYPKGKEFVLNEGQGSCYNRHKNNIAQSKITFIKTVALRFGVCNDISLKTNLLSS